MVMEDRHEFLKKGENKQMVGLDYNTRIANGVMGMMTNELAISSAKTQGAMISLPLQNARTLGASRLELGKPSLNPKTDHMLEGSAYPALPQ